MYCLGRSFDQMELVSVIVRQYYSTAWVMGLTWMGIRNVVYRFCSVLSYCMKGETLSPPSELWSGHDEPWWRGGWDGSFFHTAIDVVGVSAPSGSPCLGPPIRVVLLWWSQGWAAMSEVSGIHSLLLVVKLHGAT
nr:hypothetical protein Iba_chr03aCG7360 [Ipomoea batatas]